MDTSTRHTINDILDRFEKERVPQLSERTQRDYAGYLPILRQTFGPRIAAELPKAELASFLEVSSGRIHRNRIFSVLSSACSDAVDWGWLDYNPCSRIPRPKSQAQHRFVTAEEFEGLRRIAPPSVGLTMEIARLTGQQQGAIIGLRWSHVQEKAGVAIFRASRTGERVEVPINAKLRAVFAECRKAMHGPYVISNEEGKRYANSGFRAMWQRYMVKWVESGNERFDFHDIRWTWSVLEKTSSRKLTFIPTVFQVPEGAVERDLVAVMMPFTAEFDSVYEAMQRACSDCELRCLRADDLWEETTIIQDIFNLIYRAHVVVVDFSRKNPNVMYETGIAHTLGKTVVPLSQSLDDVPFDIKHHRVLQYLPNREGLEELRSKLAARLGFIAGRST